MRPRDTYMPPRRGEHLPLAYDEPPQYRPRCAFPWRVLILELASWAILIGGVTGLLLLLRLPG